MKRGLIAVLVVAVAGLFLVSVSGKALAGDPPKKTSIDYDKGKKGAVEFNHEAHNKTGKCADCHHKGGNVKSFDCHKVEESETSKITIKKAMHKQCKGCHKKARKKDEALGEKAPTKCKGCHK